MGGVFAFGSSVHKQSISIDMIAMKSKPIAIPRIRNKFECFPLFDELGDAAVGEWYRGAFIGDAAKVGAALTYKHVLIYTSSIVILFLSPQSTPTKRNLLVIHWVQ